MIFKSSSRAGSLSLANHLLNWRENDRVRLMASRGIFVEDVAEALQDFELMATGTRCTKPLFHVSANPGKELSSSEWHEAWRRWEQEFGLTQHTFIEVEHLKKGRRHRHRVYCRIVDGKAINLSHTRIRSDKVARILEHHLNDCYTHTRHAKAIVQRLKTEAPDVAEWMLRQEATTLPRPQAVLSHADDQLQKRTNIDTETVQQDLQAAWQRAASGRAFLEYILRQGYILARGTKRDYVVLDRTGNLHSPRRRLGIKARILRERWADLPASTLPTIEDVKDALRSFNGDIEGCGF